MSSAEDSICSTDEENFLSQFYPPNTDKLRYNNSEPRVLHSKENLICKFNSETKQKKKLKNKFKKYKLRKNGYEDEDIIIVSENLSLSLKFESTHSINNNNYEYNENIDEWTVNYLTKMAKKTDKSVKSSKLISPTEKSIDKDSIQVEKSTAFEAETHSSNEIGNMKDKPVQTNAFMLMMGARHKSIGSNSPGKDNIVVLSEDDKTKKSLKLKRNLALTKMAIGKGSDKKKMLEELRDENIKKKMEKRAEHLKAMISSPKSIKTKKIYNKELVGESRVENSVKKRLENIEPELQKPSKRAKIMSLNNEDDDDDIIFIDETVTHGNNDNSFKKSEKTENMHARKKVKKCESEFLSKLSPSIKKKESMLSYFNKLEKENEDESITENIIKVKFTPKRKAVGNSKHSSERKRRDKKRSGDNINENISERHEKSDLEKNCAETYKSCTEIDINHKELKKKKQKSVDCTLELNTDNSDIMSVSHSSETTPNNGRRSTRIKNKPKKYLQISDSDEETERTNVASKTSSNRLKLKMSKERNLKCTSDSNIINTRANNHMKKLNITKIEPSKKLAPIFTPKVQMSKEDIEAKQKFLHSGIPDTLKKIIEKQKSVEAEIDSFNSVCHIQQKSTEETDNNIWSLKLVNLDLRNECTETVSSFDNTDGMININYQNSPEISHIYRSQLNCKDKLEEMKLKYPKFPVYKIFKNLKTKCVPTDQCNNDNSSILDTLMETKIEDPNTITWCEKFKPNYSNEIIGNFAAVNNLKKWLTDWKESNFERSQRIRSDSNSSDSDFYYGSDSDSRDSSKNFNNVLVVTGPPGCGKTSTIYAIANELSMKVIEVNTSSKRSGKVILSNLQEATQSHKVNRLASSSENSQNSQEVFLNKNEKKSKRNSKRSNSERKMQKQNDSCSQNNKTEVNSKGMSFILVEDADVVFEQDDGFSSGLNQIIQLSKRPVILVTSSLKCPHLQRFQSSSNVIKFNALSPKMLGMWLNVMCVAENGNGEADVGQSLLEYFNGDIRKAINILQFWIGSSTRKESKSKSLESLLMDVNEKLGEDETSSMSWSDQDLKTHSNHELKCIKDKWNQNQSLFKLFNNTFDHDIGINHSVLQFPINHLNVWFNIPHLFKQREEETCVKRQKKCLKSLAKLADGMSVSNVLSNQLRPSSDTSVFSVPWRSKVHDGVSENINMSSYNSGLPLGDSISYALLTSAVNIAQQQYGYSDDQLKMDFTLPGLTQTRSKELLQTRQRALYDCISLSAQLDRRGLAVDYLSACRAICRTEKDKSDNNAKRNNRFCHYLRSAKVNCTGEVLETVGDSLM